MRAVPLARAWGSEYGKRPASASRSSPHSPAAGLAHATPCLARAFGRPVTSGRAAVASALRRARASIAHAERLVAPTPRLCVVNRIAHGKTPSRSVARSSPASAAGAVGLLTPMRAAPRARVRAESMANAANFRSDFSSASRESASEAEFAEPVVAHGDPVAGGARSAPSPAAAPRSPHHHPARPRRAIARAPSSAPIRDSTKEQKSRRRQPAQAARSPRRSGGWCGSVRSRRCAPRPSRAREGSEYGKRRQFQKRFQQREQRER